MRKPLNNSTVRRHLVRRVSDDNILNLVEMWFRSRMVGLLKDEDTVLKSKLDFADEGVIVQFIVRSPKKENKEESGVKISIYRYGS